MRVGVAQGGELFLQGGSPVARSTNCPADRTSKSHIRTFEPPAEPTALLLSANAEVFVEAMFQS